MAVNIRPPARSLIRRKSAAEWAADHRTKALASSYLENPVTSASKREALSDLASKAEVSKADLHGLVTHLEALRQERNDRGVGG